MQKEKQWLSSNFKKREPLIRESIVVLSVVALVICAFLSGVYWVQGSGYLAGAVPTQNIFVNTFNQQHLSTSTSLDFNMFSQVWNELKTKYVNPGKIDDSKLFYGAMQGLVAGANDPYTIFMPPEQNKSFQDSMNGSFEGIGAEIGVKDNVITVIAPIDGMPAAKAGLRAGDKIMAVNGTSTAGWTAEQAVQVIRGPKGTVVTLTIGRVAVKKSFDVKITRAIIIVKSVKADIKNGIDTIKISQFNSDTSDLMQAAADAAVKAKVKGIILDLRNNPGGYLDAAVNVASLWVKSGPVVSERYSDGSKKAYPANGNAELNGVPTIVLVNGGSASASEIVAGALKDDGLGTLLGEKTFGKGSVQEVENLPDGSSLKITVAEWLTPGGYNINHQGLEPALKVVLTDKDFAANKDPQLAAALAKLKIMVK